jgi:hypothetical protein
MIYREDREAARRISAHSCALVVKTSIQILQKAAEVAENTSCLSAFVVSRFAILGELRG